MAINPTGKWRLLYWLKNLFFITVLLSACNIPRQYQYTAKGNHTRILKPFVYKNNIEVKGGNFKGDEKTNLLVRLTGQLSDSSRVNVSDAIFFIHHIDNPPVYDSGYAALSARNMKNSMLHLGYYNATVGFKPEFKTKTKIVFSLRFHKKLFPWYKRVEKRVTIDYTVNPGIPTLIDTVSYQFKNPELEQLALQSQSQAFLAKGKPISRDNVLSETGRLVELFRNNGYYKFTADDIKVIGDTTIAILTNASGDPFENLALLEEAKEKRNKPTIKLALVINPASDSSRLKKYYVNNVYIYPDFRINDTLNSTQFNFDTTRKSKYIIGYHNNLFRTGFLIRNIFLKKGDIYNQENYSKTNNSFSRAGVWKSVIVEIDDKKTTPKDSVGKLDIIIQLFPVKKFGFETNVEMSYSSNSSINTANFTTTGNLLGLSVNASLQDRNVHKEAIKLTTAINAGIELNLNRLNTNQKINSNDLGITNTLSFPRLLPAPGRWPMNFPWFIPKDKKLLSQESFITTNASFINRFNLFKMQNYGIAFGGKWTSAAHPNRTKILKPLNIEFSYLYDQSSDFLDTLQRYPYLGYSFNTSLVMGEAFTYASTYTNLLKHPNRKRDFKFNIEESGLLYGSILGFFKNYMRKFIKTDVEYTYTASHPKSQNVFHAFAGIGIPLGKSDSTLPFFEQYYGGGANSMRGWPLRGIGIGGQPLPQYDRTGNTIVYKTGDIRLEFNYEYRHDLFQVIPNSVSLKWALFADAGNIWDFKNNNHTGTGYDTAQFNFSRLYKQLAVDIGTGLRLDFNYFLIRFDLGFRMKNPNILQDDGWQLPQVTFDHLFKRGANDEDRQWRYENFNFSIGINYPFQ